MPQNDKEDRSNLEGELSLVTSLNSQLNDFLTNLKKSPKVRLTKSHLTTKLEIARKLWERYEEAYGELYSATTSTERTIISYFVSGQNDICQNVYEDIIAFISSHLDTFQNSDSSGSNSNSNQSNQSGTIPTVVLPPKDLLKKVEIPTFDGDFQSWLTFHDLFVSMIHNKPEYSNVQKLQQLKVKLSGEASKLISHYTITNANYTDAWELLLRVYNNKRKLVDGHLNALLSIKPISVESSKPIKNLLYTTDQGIKSLKNVDANIEIWDYLVVYMSVSKLPTATRTLWEQSLGSEDDLPTYDRFVKFLENRYRTLEALGSAVPVQVSKPSDTNLNRHQSKSSSSQFHATSQVCFLCSEFHAIRLCPLFLSYDLSKRISTVKSLSLCYNCLSNKHQSKSCPSQKTCNKCKERHHSTLHVPSSSPKPHSEQSKTSPVKTMVMSTNVSASMPTKQSRHDKFPKENLEEQKIFMTALVKTFSSKGELIVLRALIDPASEASFITASAAKQLRLKQKKINAPVVGLGGVVVGTTKSKVSFKFVSIYGSDDQTEVEPFIVSSVSDPCPSKYIFGTEEWNYFHNVNLADPEFYSPSKIDLLLGLEIYSSIVLPGLVKAPEHSGLPNLHNSKLGWIVSGTVSKRAQQSDYQEPFNVSSVDLPQESSRKKANTSRPVKVLVSSLRLDELISKFWETEELPTVSKLTTEDSLCEEFYTKTVERQSDGRYVVSIPFLHKLGFETSIGRSKSRAFSRFKKIESTLASNPQLYSMYTKNINEYLELGQAEECATREECHKSSSPESSYSCYYLPHHGVTKCDKFRVVFDASCKTSNGRSLNDVMLTGPKIQNDLSSVVNNWRKHRYVFQADIEKMYRQISVTPEDADFQRFIWRKDLFNPIREYKLNRLTFGVKCSPFLALRTLRQLALDSQEEFPLASDSLLKDFYVDDLKSGADSVGEALQLQKELVKLTDSAHLPLRKWIGNHPSLVEEIPVNHRQKNSDLLPVEEEEILKSLGVYWSPTYDFFTFRFNSDSKDTTFTKRSLLSAVSKLYDPVGWISPVVVKSKILMQNLWKEKCAWDEAVPIQFCNEWLQVYNSLRYLETVRIPRWIGFAKGSCNIQLHGFCDASQKAYSAVVYVRSEVDDQFSVRLLTSKTKVSPLKPLTIPKLELCGAALLSKLIKNIKESMNLSDQRIFYWTDSTIVLSQVSKPSHKFETFVANRVASIQSDADVSSFRYIASGDNPADCASRGMFPNDLINYQLWWLGPGWLSQPESQWPSEKVPKTLEGEANPAESMKCLILKNQVLKPDFEVFSKYSSFRKTIRVLAYCKRFANNSRSEKSYQQVSYLSVKELQSATAVLIRAYQQVEFHNEIDFLLEQQAKPIEVRLTLPVSSVLSKLNPFVDKSGIIRVGGRLTHSQLSYDRKHPVILHNRSVLTEMIIKDAHKVTMHGGPQLVLNQLRLKFWVLGGRTTVRSVLVKCLWCNRVNAKLQSQVMADLPVVRIQPSIRAFVNTGVDYAGPVTTRVSLLRKAQVLKSYIAIFVCLTTRAVHIEAVDSYSSSSFLKAFQRFTSRRGLPREMYSDNGTNFVGADSMLHKNLVKTLELVHSEVAEIIAHDGVNWSFIPPHSPNFGGIWESAVKSAKELFYKTIVDSVLTFEELSTYLSQVEACLNSRPLYPLSDDPKDFETLTPGHFLIGDSLLAHPEPDLSGLKDCRLDRWQLIQKRVHQFWKKWSLDYLTTLQRRNKWTKSSPNIKVGDLVLIKEDFLPCRKWPRGRVSKVYPGLDSKVRVVDIQTASSVLQRNVRDIALLPVPTSEPQNYEVSNTNHQANQSGDITISGSSQSSNNRASRSAISPIEHQLSH